MVKIYADGADLKTMAELAKREDIAGFTTNPTLCRKAGITDYRKFASEVLAIAQGKPVSLEVLADDLMEMYVQARTLAELGDNVYVKIPITNSLGESTAQVIASLVKKIIKVNVTAVFTKKQAFKAIEAIGYGGGIVSIFAGRIADAGVNPMPIMKSVAAKTNAPIELLWASAREVYNVIQAGECGCDIITLSPELIGKLSGFGRDLNEYSLETIQQFKKDAEGLML